MKKNKLLSLLALCGVCCGSGLYGVGDITIDSPKTETQNWEAGTEESPTKVFFKDTSSTKGSISVTGTDTNGLIAANISNGTGGYLTIDFQNGASIGDLPEVISRGTGIENAHIFANNVGNSSDDTLFATAIQLASGINLEISSTEWKFPALVAFAGRKVGHTSSAEVVRLPSEGGNNTITVSAPSNLAAFADNAATVFGAAGGGEATVSGNNSFDISEENNKFSATAGYVATVFGAASYNKNATVSNNNFFDISGKNNIFYAGGDEASAVFGTASRYGNVTVSGDNSYFIANNGNTFSAIANVVATVFGAASNNEAIVGEDGGNTYTISGVGNVFSATASWGDWSDSVTTVFGAAGGGNASVSGKNFFDISGENNKFSASAGYVATIFGAASTRDNATVGVKNATENIYTISGKSNTFSATANSGNSVATVFGAASGASSATVSGKNFFDISGENNKFSAAGAAATVFGAASDAGSSTAEGMFINISGNQTFSASSKGEKINAFGADDTDAQEGGTGWRIGFYNDNPDSTTVNILAAKADIAFDLGNKTATLTLAEDQGSSYENYARAFALGNDYQIYIGGKLNFQKDDNGNISCDGVFTKNENNTGGTLNVFGAIAPAKNAKFEDAILGDVHISRCPRSKLTVDNNWTTNVYGPIEGIESISVMGNGTLNTYGSLKNIILQEGTINVYGESDGIGTIGIRNGLLKLVKCDENCAKNSLDAMTNKGSSPLQFTNPADGKLYTLENIKSEDYTKNFGTSGKLKLKEGDRLCFYVNPNIDVAHSGETFPANGRIEIDASLGEKENAIEFEEGSEIIIVDTNTNSPLRNNKFGFDLISWDGLKMSVLLEKYPSLEKVLIQHSSEENLWKFNPNHVSSISTNEDNLEYTSLARMILALSNSDLPGTEKGIEIYFKQEEGALDLCARFVDSGAEDNQLVAGTNGAMANITCATTSIFRNGINARLADVKGNGNDPYINVIAGHVHQSSIAGVGYSGDVYGFMIGEDKSLNYKDGYLRLGGALGYLHGDVDFRGSAIGKEQNSKQNNYLGALYASYETFNEKNLKTNLGFSCGLGYTKHRLNRVDQQAYGYGARMRSNNIFLCAEFVKNLYAAQGVQFGAWVKLDYNHVNQKGYSEFAKNGGTDAQTVSKVKYNFFDTTLGVNIEKEIQNMTNSDKRLRIYARAGWNCQAGRSHSTISAGVPGKIEDVHPNLGSRNSVVLTAGLRQKLDANWDIFAEWDGSFNKKHSNNTITLGAGYTF